jgi:antitoxin component YwqK of YwqJK toxin-antitoxin module
MMRFLFNGLLWTVFMLSGVALQGQNQLDEQDRKTGPWKVEYENGRTLYEANFKEGRPVGELVRYYESGAVRARMMFDTLEDLSFTRMYYKNGKQAAEGWYADQAKDSVWTYYSEFDGTIRIQEPYEDGNLQGMVRSYYPSGKISEEVAWLENKKQGSWKQYYENGSLRLKCRYENDMLNGLYEVFSADSTIKVRGAYLENNSNGIWSFYDETGLEVYSIKYEYGKAVDQEKYLQLMQDSLQKYDLITEPESIQHF